MTFSQKAEDLKMVSEKFDLDKKLEEMGWTNEQLKWFLSGATMGFTRADIFSIIASAQESARKTAQRENERLKKVALEAADSLCIQSERMTSQMTLGDLAATLRNEAWRE
jgi:hypothetical protein